MAIGNRLYELRKQKAFSQADVAEILGVSRQSVSLWETDQASPSIKNLMALSNLFDLSLDALINPNSDSNHSLNAKPVPEYAITYEENRKTIYRRDYLYINDLKALIVFAVSLFFLIAALSLILIALFQTLEVARRMLIAGNLSIIAALLVYLLYLYISIKRRIGRELEPTVELYKETFHYTEGTLTVKNDYKHIDYYVDKKDFAILYLIDGKRIYLPKDEMLGLNEFLKTRITRRTKRVPFWKSLKNRKKLLKRKG